MIISRNECLDGICAKADDMVVLLMLKFKPNR